jgi:hypothetical protein
MGHLARAPWRQTLGDATPAAAPAAAPFDSELIGLAGGMLIGGALGYFIPATSAGNRLVAILGTAAAGSTVGAIVGRSVAAAAATTTPAAPPSAGDVGAGLPPASGQTPNSQYPSVTLSGNSMSLSAATYAQSGVILATPAGGNITSMTATINGAGRGRPESPNASQVTFQGSEIQSGLTVSITWNSAAGVTTVTTVTFT